MDYLRKPRRKHPVVDQRHIRRQKQFATHGVQGHVHLVDRAYCAELLVKHPQEVGLADVRTQRALQLVRNVSLHRLLFALEALAAVLNLFSLKVQKADNARGAKAQHHQHKHGDEDSDA